jgi:hypothetical protein
MGEGRRNSKTIFQQNCFEIFHAIPLLFFVQKIPFRSWFEIHLKRKKRKKKNTA